MSLSLISLGRLDKSKPLAYALLTLSLSAMLVVAFAGLGTAIAYESNPGSEAEGGIVSIEPRIPKLMTLGTTYTVYVEVRSGGNSTDHYKIILEADGEHFFINAYEAANQPYFSYYYGYYPSPTFSLEAGETQLLRFFLMPHNLSEKSLNITAALYLVNLENDSSKEIAGDSFEIYGIISNGLAQEITAILLALSITLFPFLAFAALHWKHKLKCVLAALLHRETAIIIVLLLTALFIRSYAIGSQSLHTDESFYITMAEIGITNNWALNDKQLIYTAPIFYYLVAIDIYLFGTQLPLLRTISIVAGSLSVVVMYFLGKELFDRKVGFLSAFLLLSSAFHIYYSRVVSIDALSLLSILTFLYLFWKAYFTNPNAKYVVLAGIVLGIGSLIKFTAFIVVPTMLLSVLWAKRSLRAIFDKKIVAIVVISLLVMAPYLLYLYMNKIDPFYFNLVTRFQYFQPMAYAKTDLTFLVSSINQYTKLLTYGHDIVPSSPIFLAGTLILAITSMIFSAFSSIKKKNNFSYITSYWISAFVCIYLFFSRYHYYLLYLFVPHYIIIVAFVFSSTSAPRRISESIKANTPRIDFGDFLKRFLILFLGVVMVSSYFIIGFAIPFEGIGDHEGIRTSVLYINDQITMDGIETCDPVLVGITDWSLAPGGYAEWIYTYYFHLYSVKAKVLQLFLLQGRVGLGYTYKIDTDLVQKFRPEFIIVGEYMYSNKNYFTPEVRSLLFSEYRITMSSKTRQYNSDAQEYFVLERIA